MRTKDVPNTWDSCKVSAEPGLCGKLQEANIRRASDFKSEAPEGRKVGVRDECADMERPLGGRRRKQRNRQVLPEICSWDQACHWHSCVTFLIPSFFVCNLQVIPLSSMTKQLTRSNLRMCSDSWFECSPWKRRHGGRGLCNNRQGCQNPSTPHNFVEHVAKTREVRVSFKT